jgi:hypothetical protein
MMPMVPMLAAWIAAGAKDDEAPSRTFRLAAISLAAWCVLLIPAFLVMSGDSPRTALREAEKVGRRPGISKEITFAHRTPPSALFYAPDRVVDHNQELTRRSIKRVLGQDGRRLLIIRQEYVDGAPVKQIGKIPTKLLDRLELVWQSDAWRLYVTR